MEEEKIIIFKKSTEPTDVYKKSPEDLKKEFAIPNYINADELVLKMKELSTNENVTFDDAMDLVLRMPLVTAEWKKLGTGIYFCSNCGLPTSIRSRFCNFCGSRMTNSCW